MISIGNYGSGSSFKTRAARGANFSDHSLGVKRHNRSRAKKQCTNQSPKVAAKCGAIPDLRKQVKDLPHNFLKNKRPGFTYARGLTLNDHNEALSFAIFPP